MVGAYLGIATGMVAIASLEAMLVPLQRDFVLSVDDVTTLALTVSAGSLLVLFAMGSLVDRLGPRRVLVTGAAVSVTGAALVGLAPAFGWLMFGRVVGGVGGTAMAVAGLATLNATFTEDRERAMVFGLFSAVVGAVFIISPVVGGVVATGLTWRLVPVLWIVVALGSVVCLRRVSLPPGSGGTARELVTPLAAGTTLSALCVAALLANRGPALSGTALVVAGASFLVLLLRWRELRGRGVTPTLDVSVFATPGAKPLMGAMLAVAFVNMGFYANLFLQYRLGFTAAAVALVFLVPQVAGVLGGLVGGWVSVRWGSLVTTAAAMGAATLAALAFLAVGGQSTVWSIVALMTLFNFPVGVITGTLTKSFLDCADPEGSGAAASWRQGGWNVGATLGGVALSAIVFSYFTSAWTADLQHAGIPEAAARWAADAVRGGVPLTQIAADPRAQGVAVGGAPDDFVALASQQLATFRLVAILAAASYAVALGFVLLAMWRRKRRGLSHD